MGGEVEFSDVFVMGSWLVFDDVIKFTDPAHAPLLLSFLSQLYRTLNHQKAGLMYGISALVVSGVNRHTGITRRH